MQEIFLGIDPGVARTGYGVIEKEGNIFREVTHGCVTTDAGTALASRLHILYDSLTQVIEIYKPRYICVEELFFSKNVKTAMQVGQARGVILLCAKQHELSIFEFKPMQVKQSVSGYGGADKRQVQNMIKLLLKLKTLPSPDDAADALALAYCGASCHKHLQLKNTL